MARAASVCVCGARAEHGHCTMTSTTPPAVALALRAILRDDADALLSVFVDHPRLPFCDAVFLAVQAHKRDGACGKEGLRCHEGGLVGTIFVGVSRRQQLDAAAYEAARGDAQVSEEEDEGDNAVLVLIAAAAELDSPALLDVCVDFEPRAAASTLWEDDHECDVLSFLRARAAHRCVARFCAVYMMPDATMQRLHHLHCHLRERLVASAGRALARMGVTNVDKVDTHKEGKPTARRLLVSLLKGTLHVGRIETIATKAGTATFGLSLLGRPELVCRCESDDHDAARRLRRLACGVALEVDDDKALRGVQALAQSWSTHTVLARLLSGLSHLRRADTPVCVLVETSGGAF